ncbi:eif3i [Ecytonucleospora hepatopenaei]|uniref:Serine-threonine kinase receptor-associated protein n=1 Tax=Ecytonucleospora hepatopenaei TaxID=646526 RepID=A0A1W0E5I2_9MICR|nr:eif3i [Ecytonucleospora hepatopenaei]
MESKISTNFLKNHYDFITEGKSNGVMVGLNQKPIKEVKYNSDGDFVFGCGLDSIITMLNCEGKVKGTFQKSGGAVNSILPLDFTLFSASSDTTLSSWDIESGKLLNTKETESMVKAIDGNESVIYFLTDNSLNLQGYIGRIDLRTYKIEKLLEPKVVSTKGFLKEDFFIFGNEQGEISKLDFRNNNVITAKHHDAKITCVSPSACRNFFATSSLDATMKLIDSETLQFKRLFKAEEPVNCASIFPSNDILLSGGGINARDVTVTKGKSTFDTNFYDIAISQKIGYFNTHIGPVNCSSISPTGLQIATGGEDGRIALVNLGNDFYKAPFTDLSKYI